MFNKNNIDRIQNTIAEMIHEKIIPENGIFSINEEMLAEYIKIYGMLGEISNQRFSRNYARKLAGLKLLKVNLERGGNITSCKEGLVYLIGNPAWPEYLKIGMTMDLDKRLISYQTYDPRQLYTVKGYEFVLNRRSTESTLLEKFKIHAAEGEWIKFSDSDKIIKALREDQKIPNQNYLGYTRLSNIMLVKGKKQFHMGGKH
jgi:hypothetical protein